MIQFAWPWMLLLLPLPILVLIRKSSITRDAAIPIPPRLADALSTLSSSNNYAINSRLALIWLAWVCLIVALAQPFRPGKTVVQPVSGRAISLAVDVSGSMERQDFTLDGQVSDRLSVVKQVAHDFVLNRKGDRLSLVLYGKEAFIASPLTFDLAALASILDGAGIGMAGRSTAIGDAIGLSIQTLQKDPATAKAIVLLSDGTNNAGSVEPESAAEFAASLGIRIHTVALGSEDKQISGFATAQSADLDEETLKNIASIGKGEFFRAATTTDLQSIYSLIDTLERAAVDAPPVVLKHDLRTWPLILLLAILLLIAWLSKFSGAGGNST